MKEGKYNLEITQEQILEILKKDESLKETILKDIKESTEKEIALKYMEGLSPEEFCKMVANTGYDTYCKAKENIIKNSFKEDDLWDEVMINLYNTVKFTNY